MIIAGVDAALANTGLALLNSDKSTVEYLGKIKTAKNKSTPDESARLKQIFNEFQHFLTFFKPDVVVVENQYIGFNPSTGMALSRVRGIIQLACALTSTPFYTLQPNQIKLTVTGIGNAKKELVQESIVKLYANDPIVQKVLPVVILTGKDKTDDIADALGIAHTYGAEPSQAVPA
jgi:crossover junction endodeoxyribonuclease RuvC